MTNYEWLVKQGLGALMDWRSKTCSYCASRDMDGRCVGDSCRSGIEAWLEAPHVEPEPDTQERIDQDAGKGPCEYFGHDGMSCSDGGECRAASSHDRCHTYQRLDLLARQRKLDGVSE